MTSALKRIAKLQNFKLLSIPLYGFATEKLIQEKLFTPGPLLTTERVKLSMNFDYGSRDPQFLKLVRDVRQDLLKIGNVSTDEYTTVIMQGSGTFGVESTLQTAIPKKDSKLLVVSNGAYGLRMAKIAKMIGLNTETLDYKDNEAIKVEDVLEKLKSDQSITHVGVIHSETTAGILNPIQNLGQQMKRFQPKVQLIVDAMSSFGAYDINIKNWGIDYLISSSNKNFQGVPGFCYIIANLQKFSSCEGNSSSLSLDAYDQWKGLEKNGQFRFTPPTHVIKAFKTALDEFKERGGVYARNKRYAGNQKYISKRLKNMGFKLYIDSSIQGCIITTFLQPTHPNWNFDDFYNYLATRKQIIYPGKLTCADSFRIGSIGELSLDDFALLGTSVEQYLREKKIPIPIQYT